MKSSIPARFKTFCIKYKRSSDEYIRAGKFEDVYKILKSRYPEYIRHRTHTDERIPHLATLCLWRDSGEGIVFDIKEI